jgi:hypothetical protein
VSYGEVGLPFFELRIRAEILEHKRIDPFAEFVLRSAAFGADEPGELQALLGLGARVLDATIVRLMAKDLVALTGEPEQIRVTPGGEHVLEEAMEIEPEQTDLRVIFDPLLGDIVEPYGDYLQPRALRDAGIKEVSVPTNLIPELHQIDVRDVERVIKQMGAGHEQTSDVLALHTMRRFRVFRPGIALVYRAEGSHDVVVDVALDGQVLDRRTRALAELGIKAKLGIRDAGLEPAPAALANDLGPELARIASDEDRNRKMRNLKRAVRDRELIELASEAPDPERLAEIDARARTAEKSLERTEVKAVETYEHPKYLDDAIEKAQERLIIISPWLRRAVVNDHFLKRLDHALSRGVSVYIGWGISRDEAAEPNADKWVLARFERMARDLPALHVRRLGGTHAKILICDSRFIIVTSFNWLSFRGDPKRTFRDERGTLISKSSYVDKEATNWINRLTA